MLHLLAGPAGRPRDDREPGHVDRHAAADGEGGVLGAHVAARHHQQFVHVGRAGHDRLGAGDHDAARVALDDVDVAVDIGLLVRAQAAVALGVGHRHAQREVLVLHPVQELEEPGRVVRGAFRVVQARGDLADGIHGVVGEIALRAAGLLAQQPHHFQLVQQVLGRGVDVAEAVDPLAAGVLHRRHQRLVFGLEREVVGEGDRVHARPQQGLVGDAFDAVAVDEDFRAQAAQRFAVLLAGHEGRGGGGIHGLSPDVLQLF